MKTYSIDDVKSLDFYKDFLKNNPGIGTLKIRAYAANEAIPIKNLYISVTKTIENKTIVFFEGETNESGVINEIFLPAPKVTFDDEDEPKSISYNINVKYMNKEYSKYVINIYENILVMQNINVVPNSFGVENGY